MIPRILEYIDGRVVVTAEAFGIPEVKALLDKYDMKAEPYLAFVMYMSSPVSPYINIPLENDERKDSIIYDVNTTYGDFEFDEPLMYNAIERLRTLYMSPNMALAIELGEELHRFRKYLKDNPLTEENIPLRQAILKDIDKYSLNYTKIKQNAEKEMQVATKGDHEIGQY